MLKRQLSRIAVIALGLGLIVWGTSLSRARWERKNQGLGRLDRMMLESEVGFDPTSQGARKGYQLAEQHIRHRVGFTLQNGRPFITETAFARETGFPLRWYGGCHFEQDDNDFEQAYEERMTEYVTSGGRFENSIKPWLADFDDLATFWDKLAAERPAQRLAQDAPSITSPDGRSTLRVQRRPANQDWPESYHVILATEGGLPVEDNGSIGSIPTEFLATVRVAWGPKGSAFALIRVEIRKQVASAFDSVVVNALDLRTGLPLARHPYNVVDGELVRRRLRRWWLTD